MVSKLMCRKLQCPPMAAAPARAMECLRSKSAAHILGAMGPEFEGFITRPLWCPIIDGVSLPRDPLLAMQTGACTINRPCAQQYVGKSQSCMVRRELGARAGRAPPDRLQHGRSHAIRRAIPPARNGRCLLRVRVQLIGRL